MLQWELLSLLPSQHLHTVAILHTFGGGGRPCPRGLCVSSPEVLALLVPMIACWALGSSVAPALLPLPGSSPALASEQVAQLTSLSHRILLTSTKTRDLVLIPPLYYQGNLTMKQNQTFSVSRLLGSMCSKWPCLTSLASP